MKIFRNRPCGLWFQPGSSCRPAVHRQRRCNPQLFSASLIVMGAMLFAGPAAADSRFSSLSAAEREKAIRESMFAADNPQHQVAGNFSGQNGFAPMAPSDSPEQPQAARGDEYPKPGAQNQPSSSFNPAVRQYGQNNPNQRSYKRRERTAVPYERQGMQNQPETAVGVDGKGSVHVNTGNNAIDRGIETFIDRKVRGAQNALKNLWR